MSIYQITKSSHNPSIPFSILDLKAQSVRLPISKGSQILLSELLTWSGERGYCWWGKPAIAKDLHWSVSEVWRRATELKQAGLLEVIPRPGRSNYWVPLPGRNRMERLQKELAPIAGSRCPSYEKKRENLKRCTVPDLGTSTEQPPPSPELNENAVTICSQEVSPVIKMIPHTLVESAKNPFPAIQTPSQSEPILQKSALSALPKPKATVPVTLDHLLLVEEIERVTRDTWSRGNFLNLVRGVDEQTIYAALSITREKMTLESGVNAGAYFSTTVKGMMGLSCLRPNPKNPEPSLKERLSALERDYPHLRVHELFHRYVELKTAGVGGDPEDWLVSYEKFLETHHEEIYTTKPVYRRGAAI